ncbi:MAG: hypothetical protein AAFN81_22420 [Bacteroidota bacterium]
MKIQFSLLVVLFGILSLSAQADKQFKRGYFITTTGERIDCYINASSWPNIPSQISYRQTHVSHTVDRQDIAEIVINEQYKHVRATVMMDRSTSQMDRLGYDKEVNLEEANLLLQVLVDGPAVLYEYREFDLNRLFYKVAEQEIKQLIYKLYLKEGDLLGENMTYKEQLWNDLKCEKITLEEIGSLDYSRRPMTKFFRKYNACAGGTEFSEGPDRSTGKVYGKAFIGPAFGGFRYRSPDVARAQDLGSATGFNVGLDFEYFFAGPRSGMSVFLAPYYQVISGGFGDDFTDVQADFGMIKVPFGVRYNSFKEGNPRFYVDLSFVFTQDVTIR